MHGTDKCVFVRCALGRKGAANIVKVQCIPEFLLDVSQRFSFCKFCKPVKALAHPHEDGFEQAKFVWVISRLQVGGVEINNINVFNFLNTCVVEMCWVRRATVNSFKLKEEEATRMRLELNKKNYFLRHEQIICPKNWMSNPELTYLYCAGEPFFSGYPIFPEYRIDLIFCTVNV